MKFTWILKNKLAIGTAPRSSKDLEYLLFNNIKIVLSLNDIKETVYLNDIERLFKFERHFIPDHKSDKIMDIYMIKNILTILKELINKGPIFMHCVASVERSPLLSIAYLIEYENLAVEEALAYVMQIHPGTNPTEEQLSLLYKLTSD